MKKAYMILAHKAPEQVLRLIHSLDDNHSIFFLHFDKKANASAITIGESLREKVVLVPSIETNWGGFSLIEATLRAMQAIKYYPQAFDFVLLISGQHYPIKSNNQINNFLQKTKYHAFLEYTSLPDYDRWKLRGGLYRIDKYFFGLKFYQRYSAKALNFLSSKIDFLKRKFPSDMKPYAGSQWWIIDGFAFDYIWNFVHRNKSYSSYHKSTFAPDELYFHNILLNTNNEILRRGIANDNLLYMNWPDSDNGHPETLHSSDLSNIINSQALFARKFDADADENVLNLIDKVRQRKVNSEEDKSEDVLTVN